MEQKKGYQLALICFTSTGARLLRQLIKELNKDGFRSQGYIKISGTAAGNHFETGIGRQADDTEIQLKQVEEPVAEWTGKQFKQAKGLIFIGAAGIAVRASARWIQNKFQDPAVVVVDEKGQFAIPILSGHGGGANALAQQISGYIHAIPVITTATDVQGKFAVDLFAKEKELLLSDRELSKKISADILEGRPVGFFSDFPMAGNIPEGCCQIPGCSRRIFVSVKAEESKEGSETLYLIPRILTLGIGCRKGIKKEKLKKTILSCLKEQRIFVQGVCQAATIDLKANEASLNELCQEMGWPLLSFSADQLGSLKGTFSHSQFVERTVGVGNVCERAAVLASKGQGGKLLVTKQVLDGVTLAIAVGDWQLNLGNLTKS